LFGRSAIMRAGATRDRRGHDDCCSSRSGHRAPMG
jgi:hypothetical protein